MVILSAPNVFESTYPVNDLQPLPLSPFGRRTMPIVRMKELLAPVKLGDSLRNCCPTLAAVNCTVCTPFVAQKGISISFSGLRCAIIRRGQPYARSLPGSPCFGSNYPTGDHAHCVKLDAWSPG